MIASLSLRTKILIVVVGLLVAAAAAPFVYGYVTKYLKLGLGSGDDPYDYATVVHKQLPESTVPDEWAARLEKQAGADLGLEVRQDWRPGRGDGPWATAKEFRAGIGRHVTVPGEPYRVMGVVTNALDRAAVKKYGTVYLIWFQTPVDADRWIKENPTVFTDSAAEDGRSTWWAGFDTVYYAPPASGGTDLTTTVDGWVRSFTACPNTTRGCTVPEHIRTAGKD